MPSAKSRRLRTISGPVDPAANDTSLVDKAYSFILDSILRGELPFGAPISRRDLAEKLGMSVLPVSAAFQRLEHDSLIESVQRVGTRVRLPTPQEIRGFCIVREALESQAARLFADQATRRDKKRLLELAAELDNMYVECESATEVSEDHLYELRHLHMRFHRAIAEACACPPLLRAIERNQILTFNWLYDRFFGRQSLPDRWHIQLAEALVAGDPQKADAAMRDHVRYKWERLLLLLEPYMGITRMDLLTASERR